MSNLFDTSNAPTSEPTAIIAGDYTRWRRTDLAADYPTASYTLKYELRGEGAIAGQQYTLTATVSADDDYLVEIASATSAVYVTGEYHWFAFIVRDADSERALIDQGRLEIKADRATDAADPAAFAKKMLVKIEAAIESRATNYQLDTLAHDLGTEVSVTRDPQKLLEWRVHFRRELRRLNQRANAKKGRRPSNFIQVSFK